MSAMCQHGDSSSNIPPKVIVPLTKHYDLFFLIQLTNPAMLLYHSALFSPHSVGTAETRQDCAGRNHLAFSFSALIHY